MSAPGCVMGEPVDERLRLGRSVTIGVFENQQPIGRMAVVPFGGKVSVALDHPHTTARIDVDASGRVEQRGIT